MYEKLRMVELLASSNFLVNFCPSPVVCVFTV